jgi:hypothetical protein
MRILLAPRFVGKNRSCAEREHQVLGNSFLAGARHQSVPREAFPSRATRETNLLRLCSLVAIANAGSVEGDASSALLCASLLETI